jgi:quinol monooxygenase YgiN
MSVLVIAKVHGDTVKFRQAVAERGAEFAKIAEAAQGEGALHHRFGVGDGLVVVSDEWETAQHFEKFFANPELQAFIGSVGGDLTVAPEITITEAIESADQF